MKKTAVLLHNLGGPATEAEVRPFLERLFSDPEILRLPFAGLLQRPLGRFIARRRAPVSAANYRMIGGSPLRQWTEAQASGLTIGLAEAFPSEDLLVRPAMRYWEPSCEQALEEARAWGAERVLSLTLYPQFSLTSTGSSENHMRRCLEAMRWSPELVYVSEWYAEEEFWRCWAWRVARALRRLSPEAREPVQLVFTAHGIPMSFVQRGDPYVAQVEATVRGIRRELGEDLPWHLVFQSRAGPVRWTRPSLVEGVRALARDGARSLVLVPVSFVSDHIETLHELDIETLHLARELGIPHLARAEAFNADPDFLALLTSLARRALEDAGERPAVPSPRPAAAGGGRGMSRTVVVGAGITGLALADRLLRLDPAHDVLVLEAGARAGGRIRSERQDGYLLELGPETLLDDGSGLSGLLPEQGLAPVEASPAVKTRWIAHRGRLEPLPAGPGPLLRSKLLGLGQKLRLLSEPWRRKGTDPEESFGAFIARRFGPAVLERFAEPFASGIYAGVPEAMEMRSCFPKVWEAEQRYGSVIKGMRKVGIGHSTTLSFAGGNEDLCRALVAGLGDRLRLGAAVASLRPADGGHELELEDGSRVDAARVVLATPPPVTARILRACHPRVADECAGIRFLDLASLHLALPRAAAPAALDGFGFLIPRQESRSTVLGCLYSSRIFAGRAGDDRLLLRVLLGGARNPGFDPQARDRHVAEARATLDRLVGLHAEPEVLAWQPYVQALPMYQPGHAARLARLRALLAEAPGLHLTGLGYEGSSVPRCIAQGRALAEALAGAGARP
ncbi:MAG: protoporphyrinogen oxidase [Planctomycetota bacterium]